MTQASFQPALCCQPPADGSPSLVAVRPVPPPRSKKTLRVQPNTDNTGDSEEKTSNATNAVVSCAVMTLALPGEITTAHTDLPLFVYPFVSRVLHSVNILQRGPVLSALLLNHLANPQQLSLETVTMLIQIHSQL